MEPLLNREDTTTRILSEKNYHLSELRAKTAGIDFGNKVLFAGYISSSPKANACFETFYGQTTVDKSCEGEIRQISDAHFKDAGHSLQWGLSQ